jgi:uncharacterized membrane protein YbhN (UPF0104 family)
MQLNKNIKIFINYFLGPLLFAWLVLVIYRQIANRPLLGESWLHIKQSFQSYKITYLLIAVALIPINWGIEGYKWKISVQKIYPLSFIQAFKAVLSGVSFSVTMPNRVGEYAGRMMFLPEGKRLKAISVTLVGSFAQLLVTLIVGTFGLIIMKNTLLQTFRGLLVWYQFLLYGMVVAVVLSCLVYFNVSASIRLFKRWIKSDRYFYLVESLRNFHSHLLMRLFVLSIIRYTVFIIQYILIFYLFEVNVSAVTITLVMSIVFLSMAIIPSIALVEVGLRGEITLKLMGLFAMNSLGIGLTTVTVWFINLILPAIFGSLLMLNHRVFRKNETT